MTTSSSFYSEPFYEFDRFFDETFQNRYASGTNGNNSNANSLVFRSNNPSNAHGNQRTSNQINQHISSDMKALRPKMDLHEDIEKNLVTATFELPGVRKEDVQLDVHNGRLAVVAESKPSSEHSESGYAVRERQFGRYSRTIHLPPGLKDEEFKAKMENGLLTITFPKSAPEQAPKKITIS